MCYFAHFGHLQSILVILEILYVCCSFLKGILVILEALGMHIVKWMKVENITFIFFWQKIIYAHHNCIFLVNRRYF